MIPLACCAVLLAACGSSPGGGGTTSTPVTSPLAEAGWSVATSAGVATDQRCTTTAALSAVSGGSGLSLGDLMSMTLDQETLGATGSNWVGAMERGFLENQELSDFGFGGSGGCEKLASTGRISGYAASWLNNETNAQVSSDVHLFLSEAGAQDFLTWYPTLMKPGDSAGAGVTVTAVDVAPQQSLGTGAVRVDVTANGWTTREVAFRVKNVVATVTVAADSREHWPFDPEALGGRARDAVVRAGVTDAPFDAVVAMSLPAEKGAFPADLRTLTWDAYFGGTLDAVDAAGMASDSDAAARLAANGFQYSVRGFYSSGGSVPRVSTAVSVYATPAGATADRKALIDMALKGDSQTGRATLFDVPIPGAIGWTRTVDDGEGTFVDTRVILPTDGELLLIAFVHDPSGRDRRDDVVGLAKQLQSRVGVLAGV